MKSSLRFLAALLLFHLPMPGQQDPRVSQALYRVSREASQLWQTAPGFIARETLNQKVLVRKAPPIRIGKAAETDMDGELLYKTKEIVSMYALGSFKGSSEALHEFRESFSVDGKPLGNEAEARAKLAGVLSHGDNGSKHDLILAFEKRCEAGSATDFGQLILLFTKANVAKYSYQLAGDGRLGVDQAWVIHFKQETGSQSLHLNERGRKTAVKLEGEIWVRQGDYLPLRIALNSSRKEHKTAIRDEAKLDYTVISGALLPAALVYRRFLNDELVLESIYRYADWQLAAAR